MYYRERPQGGTGGQPLNIIDFSDLKKLKLTKMAESNLHLYIVGFLPLIQRYFTNLKNLLLNHENKSFQKYVNHFS